MSKPIGSEQVGLALQNSRYGARYGNWKPGQRDMQSGTLITSTTALPTCGGAVSPCWPEVHAAAEVWI